MVIQVNGAKITAWIGVLTAAIGLLKLYVDLLGASARRRRIIAELIERITAIKLWYDTRSATNTVNSLDEERTNKELVYIFTELERSRVKRSREDVYFLRRWLLLYEVSTTGGRLFRFYAIVLLLFIPISFLLRLYVLLHTPGQPLKNDWTVIVPPHLFKGLWSYWVILVVMFLLANWAEKGSKLSWIKKIN